MSAKKRNQTPQKQPAPDSTPFSLSKSVQNLLKDRHPILKYILGFIGCMAVFYLVYFSSFYQNHFEKPLVHGQAVVGNLLLHLLGHDTKVVGTAIANTDFSVDIQNGCDGLEAIAILVSGILIFPASRRQKITGLMWGVGVLAVLNLLRIAGLFLAGLYFSKTVFEILHVQGGFIVFTMISVLLLFSWMNWVMGQTPKPAQ